MELSGTCPCGEIIRSMISKDSWERAVEAHEVKCPDAPIRPQWKNTTSYSRDDVEREAHVWSFESFDWKLVVHRINGLPNEWFVSCRMLGIQDKALVSPDHLDAKQEALKIFKKTFTAFKRTGNGFTDAIQRANRRDQSNRP